MGGELTSNEVGSNDGTSSQWSIAKSMLHLGCGCSTFDVGNNHKKCNKIRIRTCVIFLHWSSVTMFIVVSNTHPFPFSPPKDSVHPLQNKLGSAETQ